ncbi:MAG: LmeA family phospholipid-binding protein [cyanobacterium endosymbiont of Rhopalodia sterrenbergii]
MWIRQPSKIISKVISPAVQLWLRSQVDHVDVLQMKIQGSDSQILGGYIPGIILNTKGVIYQGLHLCQADVTGTNIRINIGQMIKGKPLQLLEPIQIFGEVQLTENDLQASLTSSLLGDALHELLITLLAYQGVSDPRQILEHYEITWQSITLSQLSFALQGLVANNGVSTRIILEGRLELISSQSLRLILLKMEGLSELIDDSLDKLELDLGPDVVIESLSLGDNQLFCRAQLLIRP